MENTYYVKNSPVNMRQLSRNILLHMISRKLTDSLKQQREIMRQAQLIKYFLTLPEYFRKISPFNKLKKIPQ